MPNGPRQSDRKRNLREAHGSVLQFFRLLALAWVGIAALFFGGLAGVAAGIFGVELFYQHVLNQPQAPDLLIVVVMALVWIFASWLFIWIGIRLMQTFGDSAVGLVMVFVGMVPIVGIMFAAAWGVTAITHMFSRRATPADGASG